jgi:4'-phosphopantetheinyl transferase EntD
MQIFRDSTRKRQSLDSKIQALNANETTSKAHMDVHKNKNSREKQPGKKLGLNRAETGLGQPAQPIPGPVRHPLWPSRLSGYL